MRKDNDVVLLCGGKGSRLRPLTWDAPKPMIRIGSLPIVEHAIRLYEYYEYENFKLLIGYMGEIIQKYFKHRKSASNIKCIDTGLDAGTAERIWQVRNQLSDTFLLSYADVLADLNVDQQMMFHRKHQKIGTMTVTPLRTSYGVVNFDSNGIAYDYLEKPVLYDYWINAGSFVFESSLFDYWEWEDTDFSRGMLSSLSRAGLIGCYVHNGFWSTMDTIREYEILNELWEESFQLKPEMGEAKWAIWRK